MKKNNQLALRNQKTKLNCLIKLKPYKITLGSSLERIEFLVDKYSDISFDKLYNEWTMVDMNLFILQKDLSSYPQMSFEFMELCEEWYVMDGLIEKKPIYVNIIENLLDIERWSQFDDYHHLNKMKVLVHKFD